MFEHFSWAQATTDSPTFLVLVLFSVVTLAVALERAYYYWKRGGNPHAAIAQGLRNVGAGRAQEAVSQFDACSHPIGAVAAEVLRLGQATVQQMEEKLQVALSEQKLLLEKNLAVLGTMATVAPLVGLLGTVWGIMRAFGDMARVGSAAPSVVAAGVAEALITTAAGLVIAVPAVILYNHFTRRMNVMLIVAENQTRALIGAVKHTDRPVERNAPRIPAPLPESREHREARESVHSRQPEVTTVG